MQDIIIRGLCKSFGEKAVLCNVSGTLAAGRITGLMALREREKPHCCVFLWDWNGQTVDGLMV